MGRPVTGPTPGLRMPALPEAACRDHPDLPWVPDNGTNGHVTVPGEGVVYMWAGSIRATFSPDGTVTEAQHGVIPDDASSLCPLLAG